MDPVFSKLDELVPLMAALESLDDTSPLRLSSVRAGLESALGETLAAELTDDVTGTGEVAARFFRMRATAHLANLLAMTPR